MFEQKSMEDKLPVYPLHVKRFRSVWANASHVFGCLLFIHSWTQRPLCLFAVFSVLLLLSLFCERLLTRLLLPLICVHCQTSPSLLTVAFHVLIWRAHFLLLEGMVNDKTIAKMEEQKAKEAFKEGHEELKIEEELKVD
jgi:hypothetical protein